MMRRRSGVCGSGARRHRARSLGALALALCLAAPAAAQDPLEALRRMESLETAIQRLTAQVERLEFENRAAQRQADARLQDLEFRVIELEGGDPTEALGAAAGAERGTAPPPPAPQPAPPTPTARTPAPGPAPLGTLRGAVPAPERAAFEAARRDLETLGPAAGRDSFAAFLTEYPESPLAGEAQNLLGAAYAREGRHQEAARSFLIGVRDHGDTPRAAENLLGLASSLTDLGRQAEACSALAEMAARFPDAAPSVKAQAVAEARRAGCS